ncbi:hypothetical protein XENTR_v10024831 [Xenopus tropicalis]|uniref:Uncharacterized LOC100488277 n=1 Tax=Xenopus tropicalis TaxID=8364 RepID=A0A803JYE9_XENTR|nr:uncharacterized protein LOC100488277 [Xenopus tropicalis]KAE8581561.1 hypothetical protein XENTR_v10024831 [Xenopus tropicalis]
MAAAVRGMLGSVRRGKPWGVLVGAVKTQFCAPQSSIPHTAKQLHTHSRLWAKPELQEQASRIPEYIPQRKAKNPLKKVGLAWAIGFPSGILLFLLAKREVDKKRLAQLKVRQRMKEANLGEYERPRFNKTM